MTRPSSGLLAVDPEAPDGWHLAWEGAAVHIESQTAVIADVHLGYEWARGSGGDMVPSHSLHETIARLSSLLDRIEIDRLVVAGDLVESSSPCLRTASDARRFRQWLQARNVSLVTLQGNHDPVRNPPLPSTLEIAGWTVGHGHQPIQVPPFLVGHHHPVLRAGPVSAPCFLVGPDRILLPAFSWNAAGLDVLSGALPAAFRAREVRCVTALDGELLDFGPLGSLLNHRFTP